MLKQEYFQTCDKILEPTKRLLICLAGDATIHCVKYEPIHNNKESM